MKHLKARLPKLCIYVACLIALACSNRDKNFTVPAGYDLNKPEKFIMPESLLEISGITFNNGNSNTLYAQQDEEGKIYYLKPGDKKAAFAKFGKDGDYEDLAIFNNLVIMLRSDGTLFTFALDAVSSGNISNTNQWKDLLPNGEFEAMYADASTNQLYVLCKNCKSKKTIEANFIFQLSPKIFSQKKAFSINVDNIAKKAGISNIDLQPSALAKNPITQQWYILSSVNKMLVITNSTWQVEEVHRLDPALYGQPEGIAFDKKANLYISNEGDKLNSGNVLKMIYTGSK